MSDISTRYLGLELDNPIIVASGPLTSDIEHLKACQEAGAGAVVLKSIFEEQIDSRIESEIEENAQYLGHSDAAQWYELMSRQHYLERYLDFVREAKKTLSIPVIASINCTKSASWLDYLSAFEDAGADAIELNYYPIASDASCEGRKVDEAAIAFARAVRKSAKKAVSMKIGYKYSSLAWMIKALDNAGIDGLVLFNRFFRPDIDIEKMELRGAANPLSSPDEYAEALRWVALMSAEVKCDLAATTGIHSGESAVKLLLAGASALQLCSALLRDIGCIAQIKDFISSWMARHGFDDLTSFRGRLAQERMADGSLWERTQYIRRLMGEDGNV